MCSLHSTGCKATKHTRWVRFPTGHTAGAIPPWWRASWACERAHTVGGTSPPLHDQGTLTIKHTPPQPFRSPHCTKGAVTTAAMVTMVRGITPLHHITRWSGTTTAVAAGAAWSLLKRSSMSAMHVPRVDVFTQSVPSASAASQLGGAGQHRCRSHVAQRGRLWCACRTDSITFLPGTRGCLACCLVANKTPTHLTAKSNCKPQNAAKPGQASTTIKARTRRVVAPTKTKTAVHAAQTTGATCVRPGACRLRARACVRHVQGGQRSRVCVFMSVRQCDGVCVRVCGRVWRLRARLTPVLDTWVPDPCKRAFIGPSPKPDATKCFLAASKGSMSCLEPRERHSTGIG